MFGKLTGNEAVRNLLRRMLAAGRVPGALLFAGESGVGKKGFAIEFAKALNCLNPVNGVESCGVCSACVRIGKLAEALAQADGGKEIVWSDHRDVGGIVPAGRFITAAQARELEREVNFRPFEGKRRVFLIDDADRLNDASANALLKTLEEPAALSHLILITARPASLLPTIRSRCQVVRFVPLSPVEIEQHLVAIKKRTGAEAKLVARLAGGSIARALEFEVEAYKEQRERAVEVLDALAGSTPDRARLLRVAEEMTDARHKENYEFALDVMETILRDVWLLALGGDESRIVNIDLHPRLSELARVLPSRLCAEWLQAIEEVRRNLTVNINRRVATDALLLGMAHAKSA